MNVEMVVHSCVPGRDDIRLAFNDEPDVADEAFVKNAVYGFAVVMPARRETFYFCSFGLGG